MSFKIFSQQLFGKIKPVEIIEKNRQLLLDDYNEFITLQNSDELVRFNELENFTNSENFKKKKEEIEALHFKGSREYNQLQEFEKLKKNSAIKKYFKVASSDELKKYMGLRDSEKLNEYDKLLEYVKEGQYEKDKSEIKKQVFIGSVEEKHWLDFKQLDKSAEIKAYKELHDSPVLKNHEIYAKSDKLSQFVQLRNIPDKDKQKKSEFKTLQRDKEIKSYFKFEKSKKLKLYREISGSHDLKRYFELKGYVENEEFKIKEQYLKDKKKFEKSEAYKTYLKFKEFASDSDVKFFLKYEKSSLYKNYLAVVDSFDLKRYHELEEIISSEEFKQRKIYLEDKKKWEKTDEFAQLQEFIAMKKLPHFVKYFKYKGSTAFDFLENWEVTFEDSFDSAEIDDKKWSNQSYLANKLLGDNYSLAGDLQVFTNGENIKTGGKLKIDVRKEKTLAKVWQRSSGFLPVELEYTSAIVSSWNSFWQEDGIYEAKIKFEPVKQVVSSFFLTGENNLPRVNLLEMGTKNNVGISKLNSAEKAEINGLDISNLKKGWYIFSLEKQGNSITWKINESEVFTLQSAGINTKMHLNASSLVVHEIPGSPLPVSFEVEWVKCYRKK